MNHIFVVCCTLFFYGFGATENYGNSATKSSDTCEGDLCVIENNQPTNSYDLPGVNPNNSFNFSILTDSLSEKEIYSVAKVGQLSGDVEEKSNYVLELQKHPTADKLQDFHEPAENTTEATDDLYGFTSVTEVSKFPGNETPSSTAETEVTKTTTSTTRLSLPTAQTPFHFLKNIRQSRSICFCDIRLNQCDINCCCDEDCSLSHFKVFTKCDDNNALYDTNYCYNTNFIFGNNTSNEVVQTNKGLFCIVRQNLKVGVNYETKPIFTTLEAFNKSIQYKVFKFSNKSFRKTEFTSYDYMAESPVWTFQKGELKPFKISHSSVGVLCNSEVNIKYLVDEVRSCFYQQRPKSECGGTKIGEILHHLRGIQVIFNPSFLNKSQLFNSSKICKTNICSGITSYLCQSIDNTSDCIKISENVKDFSEFSCWNSLSRIEYQIWHNGSDGIAKMEAYLWVRKLPKISGEFLSELRTEVRYSWIGSTKKVFKRSGNPGYLTGKPVLAGRKVYNTVNGTAVKKEAIELSADPKDWLSVLGSEKGICSSGERVPVRFRENSQFLCSIKLSKNNFGKEKCVELQNSIFQLLIGHDVITETKENYFNKFVATFGNSRVEETGDWVQVLIDSFPIMSSQAYFKPNHYFLTCKNIITDLYVDVVYSSTGSFLAPQAKILGVSFQFGKHKDLTYYCDSPGCENTTFQYFKLTSAVSFIDVTKPATDAFAEPLSLEVKLPHDFFYPFFSNGYRYMFSNKFILILFFIIFLQYLSCTSAIF